MSTPPPKRYASSRLKKLMTLCIGSTVLALSALLLATLIPGSPTGGPDGPFLIAFLLLLAFLYVILPMHVIGGLATLFKYYTATDNIRFAYPLIYFVVWFLALFFYFVFSGAAEPVFEEINAQKFRGQHAAEMELLTILQQGKDPFDLPTLVEQVSDINLPDPEFGMTALQWAARGASAEIVLKLLEAGADPNIIYPRDWSNSRGTLKNASVLDIATWSAVQPKEKALHLIRHGLTPTPQALVGACDLGDLELIEKLLEGEVSLQDAVEGDGLSCFHIAAKEGDVSLIESLFSMGVVPNAVTKYKLTPLDLAMAKIQSKAAVALLKGGAQANQPKRLIELIARMPQENFELAISHQPLIALQDADATRAMRDVVSNCDVTAARRLLSAGLMLDKAYSEGLEIPEHCEFRELLVQLIRPAESGN